MNHKHIPLISQGYSMHPLLLDDDVITLKPAKKNIYQVDDIVVVEKPTHYFTHRIIYIDKLKRYLITKGDNNLSPDKKIKFKEIAGIVNQVIRSGKVLNIENLYLFQSAFYSEEISKVNVAFSKKKIPYVFLKGLPVYLNYARKLPRRIYADCDILINPSSLIEVDSIFSSLDYQKKEISHNTLVDRFLKNKAELTYWKVVNKFKIVFDIHIEAVFFFVQTNNLAPLYQYSRIKRFSHSLLSEKKTVSVNKQKYPILTVENQIVYLALHLFHDNYSGYHKYVLLEQVINSSKFSEQHVLEIIKEFKLEEFLYPSFALLKKYYRPRLSNNFLKQISPNSKKLAYIDSIVRSLNIFQAERHALAGVRRFKNIYHLSNTHPVLKPLVLLKPGITLLILFTLIKVIRATFRLNFFRLIRLLLVYKPAPPSPRITVPKRAAANQNPPSH